MNEGRMTQQATIRLGGRDDPQRRGAFPTGGSGAGGEPAAAACDGSRARLAGIYGALATGCSYPFSVVDGMTLAEAGEIFAYWEESPPTHLMVQTIARLLGW